MEEIRIISLEEIDHYNKNILKDIDYDWKSLEESIKKYGLIKPLQVTQYYFPISEIINGLLIDTSDLEGSQIQKYRIRDGNHRVKVLRELYPPNYEIKVSVIGSETSKY